MELMGLNQNLISASRVESTASTKGDNLQVSNQSSDGFQKKLDQFSRGTIEKNSLPGNNQSYRKPTAPTFDRIDRPQSGSEKNLVDQEIESNIQNHEELTVKSPKGETVDSLTRRAAIQTFMQKMEMELGVDPSEIVNAFQKLSVQELAAPPEQNVEKIISFLDLNADDQQVAKSFFDDMLAQSSANSIAEYLKATDRELSLSVMSQNQLRQQELQSGLAQMNQQFFSQPEPKTTKSTNTAPTKQENDQNNPYMWGMAAGLVGAGLGAASLTQERATPGAVATGTSPGAQSSMSASKNSLVELMQQYQPMGNSQVNLSQADKGGVTVGEELVLDQDPSTMNINEIETMISANKSMAGRSAYGLNQAQGSVPIKLFEHLTTGVEFQAPQNVETKGFETSGFDQQQSQGGFSESLDMISMTEMMDSSEMAELEGAEFTVKTESGATAVSSQNQSAPVKATGFMMGTQPTEGEQAANIKEVVSHANLLVQKGGGEMKVALNPEGMGQVNLKVSVNNGQVSVEMVTESNEAKKILEKGLGELKATLASHKLNVDHVKVDFSGEISKQFDHAHDEAQRQSAQSFMEQFGQQNRSWRQNFFDVPGARMTEHPNEGGPQDQMLAVKSKSGKSSSRRLDLVA